MFRYAAATDVMRKLEDSNEQQYLEMNSFYLQYLNLRNESDE